MIVESPAKTLKFVGKNRLDAKRKALRFWYANQAVLRESMQEFAKRCRLSSDQKVITYQRQSSR
jgi:hypothetical protein